MKPQFIRASVMLRSAVGLGLVMATLGCGEVKGGDGETHFVHCEQETDCSFSQACVEGTCTDVASGWQKVVTLESEGATTFQIASGEPGSADIVWYAYDGGGLRTAAARLRRGGPWDVQPLDQSTADPSRINPSYGDTMLHIVQDPSGEPFAIWSYWQESYDGTAYDGPPRWSRHELGSGWSQWATVLDPNIPIITCVPGSGGDLFAVFSDGQMAQYSPGTGWAGHASLPLGNVYDIVVDPDRNVLAVVGDRNSGDMVLQQWNLATGWLATPEPLPPCSSGRCLQRLVGNARGDAMIAWTSTFDDYTTEIWATLYSPDAGWGPPERIASSKDYGGFGVTIAMDPDGAATVLWKGAAADLSSRDRTGLYVARREHGRAWGPPVMIDDVNLRPASVRLSAGASGRAMVVWYRWHAAIEGVRWTGSEWTAVETISPVTGDEPRELEVALDRSGNALVGWVDTEGGALTPGVLRVRRFIQ